MVIKLQIELQDGWKTKRNIQDVRGPILVLKFLSMPKEKILFEYAPKLKDKKIFDDLFKGLEALEIIKKLPNHSSIELRCDKENVSD